MESAIKYAWEKGCVVVAAAGNSGFSGSRNTIGYPAKYLDCLCVGASRSDGQRASFSSGGREMDVVCPGQDIISCSTTNGYRSMSGTSMATPFFAGLCCLIIELMRREGYAAFTGAEAVRTFLAANTIDKGEPGRDPFWGFGVPDSRRIIEALNQETIIWL
jgi:subtilisin